MALARSTLSTPTPARPTTLSRPFAAWNTSLVTWHFSQQRVLARDDRELRRQRATLLKVPRIPSEGRADARSVKEAGACLGGGADDKRVCGGDPLAQLLRRQAEGLLHVAVLLQQLYAWGARKRGVPCWTVPCMHA